MRDGSRGATAGMVIEVGVDGGVEVDMMGPKVDERR